MTHPIRTKLSMWTRWGYCMTPQVFESKRAAMRYAKKLRDCGYIFGYSISQV